MYLPFIIKRLHIVFKLPIKICVAYEQMIYILTVR